MESKARQIIEDKIIELKALIEMAYHPQIRPGRKWAPTGIISIYGDILYHLKHQDEYESKD
jgi:hypothetical protein